MALNFFDAELEVGRAVALDANLLIVLLADLACFSHIDRLRKKRVLLGVDDRVRVDRNENFVTLAMNSNAVVEVFEFIAWRELHKDVLANTRRDHALLVVFNLKKGCRRRQNM